MAANVETMFYVRETPWHGLGTKVMMAPTSEDGSFSMTMDLYAHAIEDLKRREMEKMRGTV